MSKALLAAGLAVLSIGLIGCDRDKGDDELASMELNITMPPSFAGNSVLLCGERTPKADEKYACNNYLMGNTADDKCECFNFLSTGQLEDPDHLGDVFQIKDLCPSKDLAKGTWDFTYQIYVGRNCPASTPQTPTILNPGFDSRFNPNNFACYDVNRLGWQNTPNQTIDEELRPGCNYNEILCITENATKIFDFDVCHQIEECRDENHFPDLCPTRCMDESGAEAACTETNTVHPRLKLDCGCHVEWCDLSGDGACRDAMPADATSVDGRGYPYCVCDQGINPLSPAAGCFMSPFHGCDVLCY